MHLHVSSDMPATAPRWSLHYEKRKYTALFGRLEENTKRAPFLTSLQNYCPLHDRFFSLNETNWNSVTWNHPWYIVQLKEPKQGEENRDDALSSLHFVATVKHAVTGATRPQRVFAKMAPLLDPFQSLVGKVETDDMRLQRLPRWGEAPATDIHTSVLDPNNSAYIDAFFVFLTNMLREEHQFVHGIGYYGSFLGVQRPFRFNIYDDLDYLEKCDYFLENKNKRFQVEDYDEGQAGEGVMEERRLRESGKRPPLAFAAGTGPVSLRSVASVPETLFSQVFTSAETTAENELQDITIEVDEEDSLHLSNSSCSSRTSYTHEEVNDMEEGEEGVSQGSDVGSDVGSDEDVWEDEESGTGSGSIDNETVYATLPAFPVNAIFMEDCGTTMDELILGETLTDDEWFSMLMQIVLILATYQRCFAMTHNDLHSNNVLFVPTKRTHIYYQLEGKVYCVPTYGRLFRIIDFGRAIYTFDGKHFCSNTFQKGDVSSSQYNCEPYFNPRKPRVEPNYSFDLTRLACSLFDFFIEDIRDIKRVGTMSPLVQLIVDWCADDHGRNLLYKQSGEDRYPEFKLYKMIARGTHHQVPREQLERPVFAAFRVTPAEAATRDPIKTFWVDVDSLPVYSLHTK